MPKIICHMITSVDGRLYPDRWSAGPDVTEGLAGADMTSVYEGAASHFADAAGWIVGRTTMAEYAASVSEHAPAAERTDGSMPAAFVGDRQQRKLAVVFDPHGKLHYEESGLPTGEHLVAVLSPKVGDAYLESLRRVGVSYVFAADDEHPLASGLVALEKTFDARMLLLEGGGVINGAFLKAGLINELSIVVYPAIDGLSGVSSIFEYKGAPGEKPAQDQHLKFIACEPLAGGAMWLRYAVQKNN